MKRYYILLVFTAISATCCGQNNYKRIKIVLLGTFHFHQSLDSNSRLHTQLFTQKRQKEVADIVDDLVKFAPDKIFVERKVSEQGYTDSLYTAYKNGHEPKDKKVLANEIVQLGFQTAKRLHLAAPICVDFRPEAYSNKDYTTQYPVEQSLVDIWRQFEDSEDNTRSNSTFLDKRYPLKRTNMDSLLQKSTLKEFLIYMNRPDVYTGDTYRNWNWFYSKGGENDYTGMDWLANFWHGRNIKIYGNILRQVDYQKDQKYVLIIGASHISLLKYLFSENPYFEVVDVDKVLLKK